MESMPRHWPVMSGSPGEPIDADALADEGKVLVKLTAEGGEGVGSGGSAKCGGRGGRRL